ncbi:hypothetical protein ACFYT4_28945 [Streptomyces sp. NPDC004609]|uniref:hypothetical protein n=1 Tax=Streptomyces sp. NPDC004609 TaxID=3364704 RepID=UPI0036B4721A
MTALALTASGCVTVHGERAVVPAATKAEAAEALREFTAAYNAADKAYDPALDADRVTGALGAINQAGLKSRRTNFPGGNPRHVPLELTDAKFTIPKKAGWPRYFVADADPGSTSGRGGANERWLLVFLRGAPADVWKAAYLTVLPADRVPELETDDDGFAEPVPPDATGLVSAPGELGKTYTAFMQTGEPKLFVDGPHTSGWRDARKKSSNLPGISTQWIDQPLDTGDFAPLALATEDDGALVFFTIRNYERQTAAKGVPLKIHPDVRPLLTGNATSTITKERVSSQAVLVPPAGGSGPGGGKVEVLGRLAGLTTAKGG